MSRSKGQFDGRNLFRSLYLLEGERIACRSLCVAVIRYNLLRHPGNRVTAANTLDKLEEVGIPRDRGEVYFNELRDEGRIIGGEFTRNYTLDDRLLVLDDPIGNNTPEQMLPKKVNETGQEKSNIPEVHYRDIETQKHRNIETLYDDGFSAAWNLYPAFRRDDEGAAHASYNSTVKPEDRPVFLATLRYYLSTLTEPKFTKGAAKFFAGWATMRAEGEKIVAGDRAKSGPIFCTNSAGNMCVTISGSGRGFIDIRDGSGQPVKSTPENLSLIRGQIERGERVP